MKRLANTLYVTTEGTYLAKEGETVVVRLEDKVRLRVPIHNLDGIVCFGACGGQPVPDGPVRPARGGAFLFERERTVSGPGTGTGKRQCVAAPPTVPRGR